MLTSDEITAVAALVAGDQATYGAAAVANPNTPGTYDVSVQALADLLNAGSGGTVQRPRMTQAELLAFINIDSLTPQQTNNLTILSNATIDGVSSNLFNNFRNLVDAGNHAAFDAAVNRAETRLEAAIGRVLSQPINYRALSQIAKIVWPEYIAPSMPDVQMFVASIVGDTVSLKGRAEPGFGVTLTGSVNQAITPDAEGRWSHVEGGLTQGAHSVTATVDNGTIVNSITRDFEI